VAGKGDKHTEKKRRTRKISIRLSEPEYSRVLDELEVCGLTVSALARRRILGQSVASRADLAVLAELRRLGGLLKHIHNETLGAYSGLTAQAIRDLSAYVRALTAKQRNDSGSEDGQ
jgi:phosphate uptake regulator